MKISFPSGITVSDVTAGEAIVMLQQMQQPGLKVPEPRAAEQYDSDTLSWLSKNDRVEGLSRNEVAEAFSITPTAAGQRLRKLMDVGLVSRIARGRYRACNLELRK